MAPEPGREAEREGEWVMGGTTVQPCLERGRSASLRKIAWISEALREEKAEWEELDAIAARRAKQERRRRKRVGEEKKVVGAFF